MQAVKEKLSDMSTMRKAKAEAKAEEKAEKELAKTRVEVAHEIRKAREAEATMDLHVAKAGQKVDEEMAKHSPQLTHEPNVGAATGHHHGPYPDGAEATMTGITCPTNTAGAPPTNKYL